MEQVEYLSVAVQLKLISEKKDIFKNELDMVIEERNIIFEQYAAHNTKREYLSFVVGKTKEEIQHNIQAKEDLELSLAHLLVNRALRPQNMELLPADVDADYFEEIEIQDKENEILLMDKEIESLNEKLIQSKTNLNELLIDKEILDKHREVCRKYQLAQKAYNDVLKEEIQIAQKLLLIYRKLKD